MANTKWPRTASPAVEMLCSRSVTTESREEKEAGMLSQVGHLYAKLLSYSLFFLFIYLKSSSLQSLLTRLEFPSELFLFQMAVSGRGSERDRPTGNVICCGRLVLGTAVMWMGESTRFFFFTRVLWFLSPLLFLYDFGIFRNRLYESPSKITVARP